MTYAQLARSVTALSLALRDIMANIGADTHMSYKQRCLELSKQYGADIDNPEAVELIQSIIDFQRLAELIEKTH